MALTDLERKRCERDLAKFMERRRPPPQIRPQLDIGYRISGQSVEIFEIRTRLAESERNDGASGCEGYVRENEESLARVLDAP